MTKIEPLEEIDEQIKYLAPQIHRGGEVDGGKCQPALDLDCDIGIKRVRIAVEFLAPECRESGKL